jgi:hypothetical protein
LGSQGPAVLPLSIPLDRESVRMQNTIAAPLRSVRASGELRE